MYKDYILAEMTDGDSTFAHFDCLVVNETIEARGRSGATASTPEWLDRPASHQRDGGPMLKRVR